jgi:hypothetical protein
VACSGTALAFNLQQKGNVFMKEMYCFSIKRVISNIL